MSPGLKKASSGHNTVSEGYQDHSLLLFASLLFLLRVLMSRPAADGRSGNTVRAPVLPLIQLGSVWKGERCACCAQLTRPAPDVTGTAQTVSASTSSRHDTIILQLFVILFL